MGARFLRLGLAGFKSFADATTLEILPGLTGVVGPNGCGKSNVAEALRWAMGEANARHLRGGEMDDVIFAGTANRPSRNLAEVSLSLEGDPGGLPPPFTGLAELQVTRRIERGSGSSYRVNGREARARDVQTLFADLASGARASAMVSQGRVSQLVGARPEERRTVLEEAAGITGLHARRAEAEARLRATEANLERAHDRSTLLAGQLDGLTAQARQATRYRQVTGAVLEAEALALAIQQGRVDQAQAAAETARGEALDGMQRATIDQVAAAAAAEAAQAALPALRERENGTRIALERSRLLIETLETEAASADAALAAAQQRRAQMARDQAHAETVLQDAEAADARLVAESARTRQEIAAHPEALALARAQVAATATNLQAADHRAAEATGAVAEAQAASGALQQLLDQAEARARRAMEGMGRLQAEANRAAMQLVDPAFLLAATGGLAEAETRLAALLEALDQAEATRARAAPAAAAARDAHGRLDAARHRAAAETAALAELLAVKDGEHWPPLLDQLTVPPGLETALGAVLGEELAAAQDPGAARHWRSLPAHESAPSPPAGRLLLHAVQGPALLARALGAIGVVPDEAAGQAGQSALRPGQSLVSEAGGVWRWDGYTVRAGTPSTAAVRLRQRNRLATLRTELAAAAQEAEAARLARIAADAADRAAAATEQQLRATRRDAEAALDRARGTALTLQARAEAASARRTALADQVERLSPEVQAASQALHEARTRQDARPDPAALRRVADAARQAVTAARTADAAAARTLEALGRAESARQTRFRAIDRERDDRRMRAAELSGRVKDLVARAAEAATEHDRLLAAPARVAERRSRARVDETVTEAALHDALAASRAADHTADLTRRAARDTEHAVFAARDALVRAEAAQMAAAAQRATVQARIAERQGALPALPVPTDLSQAAEDQARSRQGRLTRERDEMGPVNLRAEIEARAIEADITTTRTESEALTTAIARLRGSIGHLNREGRERLSAVFHAVDTQFQTLFARMFGGGRAHLALVGSDDPLLAGLEIYAQPPGKKLSSLALLSGGEQALTALSLIFAVFRCNPAPLCVLDEVDAPLDDANVERFCALLADMARETGTRFLVVTHHQVTMARMDRLYGVTMQERGVSRLLSVDLSRASAMVDGGTGPAAAEYAAAEAISP